MGTSVAILHSYEIVHYGLRSILREDPGCDVKGYLQPGDALSGIRSGEYRAIFVQVPKFITEAADFTSLVPTICLSDETNVNTLKDAISLGASGFVLMADPIAEYRIAIEIATQFGKLRARGTDIGMLINRLEKKRRIVTEALSELTSRDLDVLELIAQGMPNKKIANELHISHGSARNRVSSLLSKTDQPNRTALALWAVENGIVNVPEDN